MVNSWTSSKMWMGIFLQNLKSERVRRVCAYEICVSAMRMPPANATTRKRQDWPCKSTKTRKRETLFSCSCFLVLVAASFWPGRSGKVVKVGRHGGWWSMTRCFRALGIFSMYIPKWRIPERGWYYDIIPNLATKQKNTRLTAGRSD